MKSKKLKPIMKWQVGKYDRHAEFKFILPDQFLLLCKLMDVTPETVLLDFLDNLNCGSWKREGRENVREILIEYFIEHGYGQNYYNSESIRQIFKEMKAVGLLFPNDSKEKMLDSYVDWREKHYKYWFKKWLKNTRQNAK